MAVASTRMRGAANGDDGSAPAYVVGGGCKTMRANGKS